MRFDHWIKQLFILPGCVFALILTHEPVTAASWFRLLIGLFATCLLASANYIINEYLDADFDKYHPTKKLRPAVTEGVSGKIVWLLWAVLATCGLLLSCLVNRPFLIFGGGVAPDGAFV